jgi:hypothetical protein
MTTLCGIAADEGSFCAELEPGAPLGLALALALGAPLGICGGLALGVGDCPVGLTGGEKPLCEAVALPGSPRPEIRNPTPIATPTSTTALAMIEINLLPEPPDPSPGGPGG